MSLEARVRDAMELRARSRQGFYPAEIASEIAAPTDEVTALVHELAAPALARFGYFARTQPDGSVLYNVYAGDPLGADPTTPEAIIHPPTAPVAALPRMTVGEWLTAFKAASGLVRSLSSKRFLADAQADGDLEEMALDSELSQRELMLLLLALEKQQPKTKPFLLSFVWQDDATDHCVELLEKMLRPTSQPIIRGVEAFEPFLALYNAEAAGQERAYVVELPPGYEYLVIVLRPEIFASLTRSTEDGLRLLLAHAPAPGPGPRHSPGRRACSLASAEHLAVRADELVRFEAGRQEDRGHDPGGSVFEASDAEAEGRAEVSADA